MEAQQLRAKVEATLGRRVTDRQWSRVEVLGLVDVALEPDDYAIDGYQELVETLRDFTAASASSLRPALPFDEPELEVRSDALSAWAERWATPDAAAWRERAGLTGRLMSAQEIDAWIREQPAGEEPRLATRLCWPREDERGEWVTEQAVVGSGLLGDLMLLAERLRTDYRWPDQTSAVAFVLTGLAPEVDMIVGSARGHYFPTSDGVRSMVFVDAFSSVSITIDPTVTPEQLARWWRGVRADRFDRRQRSQSSKHVRLAGFMAGRDPSEKWDAHRRAWNDRHPDQRYEADDVRQFQRDATAAIRRLMHSGFRTHRQ